MIRTQIELTPEQLARLESLAKEQKTTVSELIRREIDRHLLASPPPDIAERQRRALQAIGKYRAGKPDLSKNHDAYLREAHEQ